MSTQPKQIQACKIYRLLLNPKEKRVKSFLPSEYSDLEMNMLNRNERREVRTHNIVTKFRHQKKHPGTSETQSKHIQKCRTVTLWLKPKENNVNILRTLILKRTSTCHQSLRHAQDMPGAIAATRGGIGNTEILEELKVFFGKPAIFSDC